MGLKEEDKNKFDINKIKITNKRQGSIYELPEEMWETLEEMGTTEITFVDLEWDIDNFLELADPDTLQEMLKQEIEAERYENVVEIEKKIKEWKDKLEG